MRRGTELRHDRGGLRTVAHHVADDNAAPASGQGNEAVLADLGAQSERAAVAVRDSKNQDGPRLAFPADTWKAFANQLKTTVC